MEEGNTGQVNVLLPKAVLGWADFTALVVWAVQ